MAKPKGNSLIFPVLLGAALGSIFTYFFDNRRGKYRQDLVKGKLTHFKNRIEILFDRAQRRARYRTLGLISRLHSELKRDQPPVLDDVLVARVRSKMGRYVSHPHLVGVEADRGKITLHGVALPEEIPAIESHARSVRGVKMVDNQLKESARLTDPRLQPRAEKKSASAA